MPEDKNPEVQTTKADSFISRPVGSFLPEKVNSHLPEKVSGTSVGKATLVVVAAMIVVKGLKKILSK